MKDFVAVFRKETYPKLAQKFVSETALRFIETEEEAAGRCVKALKSAAGRMAALQEAQGLPPAAYLTVSVLYTSVYFGAPRFRLDFYDERWMAAEPLYSEEIDAGWLFFHWKAHLAEVGEARGSLRASIRESHVESMCWQSVRLLAYWLAAELKYWLAPLAKAEEFSRLQKADMFYVTFGEYLDWQKPVFAILPEIDIFNCGSGDSLRLRTFRQCRYANKEFSALDLSGSRFYDCRFENCVFEETDLGDVCFENCRFLKTSFREVNLSGALFRNSALKEITMVKAAAEAAAEDGEKRDLYRPLAFEDCVIEAMTLKDCAFTGALLSDCLAKEVAIEGGRYEDTDFEEFVNSREE